MVLTSGGAVFNYAHSVIISPKILSRTIRLGAKNSWRENCSAAERERIRQRFLPDVTQIFAHRRFDSFARENCPTKKGGPSDESRTPITERERRRDLDRGTHI